MVSRPPAGCRSSGLPLLPVFDGGLVHDWREDMALGDEGWRG